MKSSYSNLMGFTDKSAALITVVILIFILTILSSAILSLLSNQTRLIEHDISRTKAKYADEATMVRQLELLRNGTTPDDTHYITGRYDDEGQSWEVDVSNRPYALGVIELNMSLDYSPENF